MKIVHRAQRGWGVGHVLAVSEDPPRLSAQFPGRPGGPVMLSSRDAQLSRFRFAPDSPALLADGSAAGVLRALPGRADDLYRYTVEVPGNKPQVRSEADLRAPAPREGPAEQLASGRWGTPEDFHLRSETVRLDLERRADALGALFASRVYVKPHQVSVAHQVLSAPQPRFVLADEVGLGKTIEAGLGLSRPLPAGLGKRCPGGAPRPLPGPGVGEPVPKIQPPLPPEDPRPARGGPRGAGRGRARRGASCFSPLRRSSSIRRSTTRSCGWWTPPRPRPSRNCARASRARASCPPKSARCSPGTVPRRSASPGSFQRMRCSASCGGMRC